MQAVLELANEVEEAIALGQHQQPGQEQDNGKRWPTSLLVMQTIHNTSLQGTRKII